LSQGAARSFSRHCGIAFSACVQRNLPASTATTIKVHTMVTKQKKQEKAPPAISGRTVGAVAPQAESVASKIRAAGQYFEDAKNELGKVSWPTPKEIKATSIAVLILVVIMSFFFGIVDVVLAKIVEVILSIGLQ
jgi:preprotein translocase subunit SecE